MTEMLHQDVNGQYLFQTGSCMKAVIVEGIGSLPPPEKGSVQRLVIMMQ